MVGAEKFHNLRTLVQSWLKVSCAPRDKFDSSIENCSRSEEQKKSIIESFNQSFKDLEFALDKKCKGLRIIHIVEKSIIKNSLILFI